MTEEDKTQKVDTERRSSFRIPLRVLKIDIENEKREIFFGYAGNISCSGMLIQTSNPKELGARFNIRFSLPSKIKNVSCEAEVAWIQDYDPKIKTMPGMGIKFLNLSTEDLKEIEEFINKNSD